MDNLAADFIINLNNPIEAEFELGETEHFDCSFELFASGTVWGSIDGNIENQTDLYDILSTQSGQITSNHNEITSLNQTLQSYGDIVTYDAADFATAAQGALANTALQPGDNITELNNNAGYITSASLPTVNDGTLTIQVNSTEVGTFSANQSSNKTINIPVPDSATWGNITGDIDDQTDLKNALSAKYDASNPDGFISGINGTDVVNALGYTPYNSTNPDGYITSSALSNYVTINSAQTITANKSFHNAELITDNFITLNGTTAYLRGQSGINYYNLMNLNSSGITVGSANQPIKIAGNATRPKYNSSDLALYSDIPSLASYLINNATGTNALAVGDSSQSTAEGGVAVGDGARANSTYSTAVGQSTRATNTNTTVIGRAAKATEARAIAIGSGAEANAQDAIAIKGINNTANTFQVYTYNMLDMSTGLIPDARISTNIARTTDIPTVNDGTLTIQVNGTSVGTFTANQSGNTTANIVVPDSATWGNITGDIADQTDLQDALDDKQDVLSGGRYIEIVSGGTIATLPEGCKQVEYITATGTQHLDTLITATNDYEIRAKFRLTELNDSFLYGARQAYGSSSFALHKNYAPFSTDVGTGYVNLGVDSWYNAKQNKNGIYINDVIAHSYNNSLASFTTPNTIRVFAMAQGDNALYGSTFMKGDFASFEIYNNGVLVCNLVPCIDSNDVACMYDTVNERFLYNLGTGNFTAGPEVVPSDTINCTLDGSDINTLLGYTPVNPSSLATVATSGDYDDLINKPTIPTVGDGTITITQGGVTKGTFTTNQSGNSTIALDAGGGGGIQNTATGTDSLTILGTPTSADYSVNIGVNSEVTGDNGIALGNLALSVDGGIAIGQNATTDGAGISIGYQCDTVGFDSIAIGYGASSIESYAIQIGDGRNTTANSFQVATYQLLDTSTGLIPDARISSNIARTSAIPTVNDATLTIQKNGSTIDTFTANSATNTTVNITVPTDTGDLTNNAGFITGITSGDVTTALGYTPYNSTNPNGYISGITSSDVTAALGYTPLNTDASNLSSTGQKVFDGGWVDQSVDLASNVSMAASGSKNYSLSSYLPNDGAIYEVKFSIEGETGNTSGNGLEYRAYSDVLTSSTRGGVIAGRTRTSSTMLFASSFILPIGSGRKIYIDNSNTSASSTLVYLRAQGYKRKGTNA